MAISGGGGPVTIAFADALKSFSDPPAIITGNLTIWQQITL